MRQFFRFAVLLGLLVLGFAHAGYSQVAPSDINKTQIRPSADALGLGGSYLLLNNDPNGIITNPAAVGFANRAGIDLAVEGQTSNVNISDLNNLVNDLKNLNNQINDNNGAPNVNDLQSAEGSFNDVYNFATNAGADPNTGSQARLSGAVSFGGAGRWTKIGNFSIGTVAYGGLTADVRLNVALDNSAPTNGAIPIGNRAVAINGGALALTNIGIPVAYQLPGNGGTVGLTPKFVRADYDAFSGTADEAQDTVSGTSFNEVNGSTFDLDAGYTSSRFTFSGYTVQGAAVVRHILNPSFHLTNSPQNGSPATGPSNFDFSLSPEADIGASVAAYGVRVIGEAHDLTNANGGGKTFHVGAEYTTFKYVVPRIGYDNNAFVYGLGLSLGPVMLNAAASTNVQQRAAVDLSVNFGL